MLLFSGDDEYHDGPIVLNAPILDLRPHLIRPILLPRVNANVNVIIMQTGAQNNFMG